MLKALSSSPSEGKDDFPVFLCCVFDELHLIQNQMPPFFPQKVTLVFHEKLVGCQTYMEAIGVIPGLQAINNLYVATFIHLKNVSLHSNTRHASLNKKKKKFITILLDLRSFPFPR